MDTDVLCEDALPEEAGLFDYAANESDAEIVIAGEDAVRPLVASGEINGDGRFELKTEAWILRLAYSNDKLLSLSNSRTQILAHQIESTYRVMSALNPRFLLADEVGLGKTIEAGLALKEMVFRHGCRRVLIICPASLVMQWQNELASKFNEHFTIMDRQSLAKARRSSGNANPWMTLDKIICSLDFIKSKSNTEMLSETRWDSVVIDEAHRMRRDSLKSTLAYTLGEMISTKTKSFLLLTATPFRGKLEELYYLIRLLDPNLLGPFQTFYNTYCIGNPDLAPLREKISEVIIRRTKKEVGGFTRRMARTIRFELFPEERALYDATTRYVSEEYNRAMQAENRAVGFVMTVFQKLLDSSSNALLSALKNRKNNLESLLAGPDSEVLRRLSIGKTLEFEHVDPDDIEEPGNMLLQQSLKKTRQELQAEILTIGGLIDLAEAIPANKKGEKLKEIIRRLIKKSGKILIFTQFRTTQDYLKDILSEFSIELFHGSLSRDQKEEAILNFREHADILISTEAGGEGRNLQFCHVLINYDLPWSPLKIEQRIGRIHRFGQSRDVQIFNFSTAGTVAEKVLQVLERKLKLFEESIGAPDILLGQIEEELNLNSIFMEMLLGRKSARKLGAEIDENLEKARRSYEKLSELAVTQKLDFNYDEYYRITLRERAFSNQRIEDFISRAKRVSPEVDTRLGRKSRISRLYPINGDAGGRRFGTFDSARALENDSLEFLAFGNPIVDDIIDRCSSAEFGGFTGIRGIKYGMFLSGMIFHYLVRFHTSIERTDIIPVVIIKNKSISENRMAELEKLALLPGNRIAVEPADYRMEINRIVARHDEFFTDAREQILMKVEALKADFVEGMTRPVRLEIEKINDAFSKKLKELEEQLERQECQMKWFDKDMKSAIGRTRNRIGEVTRERDASLARFHGYLDVTASIRLINAGILITRP